MNIVFDEGARGEISVPENQLEEGYYWGLVRGQAGVLIQVSKPPENIYNTLITFITSGHLAQIGHPYTVIALSERVNVRRVKATMHLEFI